MATHDYVIDNSTGANVRSDINNVLQAILTNNSSSSAPSTTAAYMWWADTTTGILKIRNSANDGWVELLQLDGTLTLEDGSASTPALAFRDDLDTGIFSSAANNINFATGGVERLELSGSSTIFNESGADVNFRVEGDTNVNLLFIDAGEDRIGVNENTPLGKFHIKSTDASVSAVNASVNELVLENNGSCGMSIFSSTSNQGAIAFGDSDDNDVGKIVYDHSDNSISFRTAASERMRVNSSGRLLIGSTVESSHGGIDSALQVIGTGTDDSSITMSRFSNDVHSAYIVFSKSRNGSIGGNTVVQSGDSIGRMTFFGNDGTDGSTPAAEIDVEVDGTPGSNDMPGRIVFRTTADGASSVTERMRIDSAGIVGIGVIPTSGQYSGYNHLQVGESATLSSNNTQSDTNITNLTQNAYLDATASNWKYLHTDEASRYQQYNGRHHFSVASSGSADANISFTEKLRLDSDGLKFNSDSSSNNALNDYEIGTFTCTITGSSSSPSYSTSSNGGFYVKIGHFVSLYFLLIINSVSSQGSGNIQIEGIPFSHDNNVNAYRSIGLIGYNDIFASEVNKLYVLNNDKILIIPNGVTQSNQTFEQNALSTGYFGFSITYRSDA